MMWKRGVLVALALVFVALTGCSTASPKRSVDRMRARESAARTLDELHESASLADETRYFDLFADDAIFLGTEASERWTVDAFRGFAHPHFASGKGWTYRVKARHLSVSAEGDFAWFHEILDNDKLGECRGTGVLRLVDGAFKVVLYDLTIPIPNDLAEEVVAKIRAWSKAKAEGRSSPRE